MGAGSSVVARSVEIRNHMARRIDIRRRTAQDTEADWHRYSILKHRIDELCASQSEKARILHTLELRLAQALAAGTEQSALADRVRLAAQAHTAAEERLDEFIHQCSREDWEKHPEVYERIDELRLGKMKYRIEQQYQQDSSYLFKRLNTPLGCKDDCTFCLESVNTDPEDPRKLPCGHVLHHQCLREWFAKESTCPTCRQEFRIFRPNGQPDSYFRDLESREREEDLEELRRSPSPVPTLSRVEVI